MFLAAMTTKGWVPGPRDLTIAGWIIFAGYLAVALRAWVAARREAARGLDPFLWRALTAACVLLALDKQLDLHNALTTFGRGLARSEGWYEQRRGVQLALLGALALAAGMALRWIFRRAGPEWRRHRLTAAGIMLLVTFLGMRTISFHYLDLLLRIEVGRFRLNAVLEFACICLLFLATRQAARQPETPAGP